MNKINFTAGSAISASQLNTLQTNIDNAYASGVKSVASSTNSDGNTVLTFTHYDGTTTTITLPKGSSLNFNVVGGTTAPASPTNNTIWVKTSATITDWAFGNSNPYSSPSAGNVYFRTALSGILINVIEDNTINIYLNNAQQYLNGIWTVVECSVYQNGKWVKCVSYLPEFTYTGDYKITDDYGVELTEDAENWQIQFLTSGDLKFTALNGATDGIDIFLVGGGGGGTAVGANPTQPSSLSQNLGSPGGGSGYTKTHTVVEVANTTLYPVVVGAGGAIGVNGGQSNITIGSTTYSAEGGNCSTYKAHGGPGGSGGAGGGGDPVANGGIDGGNGGAGVYQGTTFTNGGAGQGTTTKAFGEADGVLYATGGGAGGNYGKSTGVSTSQGTGGGDTPNTGDGGKGGGYKASGGVATAGGSGIVIIRNTRG